MTAPMSRCRISSRPLEAADVADEAARAIGAANTLWLDAKGMLNASNTDAYGFMTQSRRPGAASGTRAGGR